MTRTTQAVSRFAGGAGVVAASCAVLCCAGAPIIVVFIHGMPAKVLIGAGALTLLAATVWNARLPRSCDDLVTLRRA
jgi:hypothetical protein